MKRTERDLASVLTVLAISLAVALVFPYEAFRFAPSAEPERREPVAAFVRLSSEMEAKALKAAKSSWQGSGRGVRHLQADLWLGEIPETPTEPVTDVAERTPPPAPSLSERTPVGYLPSRAAAVPAPLAADSDDLPKAAFPKEELLKMKEF